MHDFLIFAANNEALFTILALVSIVYPLLVFKDVHDKTMLPAHSQYLQDDMGFSLAAGIVRHCGWPKAIVVYGGIAASGVLMSLPTIALAWLK